MEVLTFLISIALIEFSILTDCNVDKSSILDCYQRCRTLYKGTRNYFNQTSALCQVVRICNENQSYDYLTNKCSQIRIEVGDFPKLNTTTNSSTLPDVLQAPKIVCANGYFISNTSSICICYQGWKDGESDIVTNPVTKCNQIIEGFTNNTNNQVGIGSNVTIGNNDPNILPNSDMPVFYKVIIIVCSISLAGYVCCGLCLYYKLRNKSKNYEERERENVTVEINDRRSPLRDKNRSFNKTRNYERDSSFDYKDQYNSRRQLTFQTPIKRRLSFSGGQYKQPRNIITDYNNTQESYITETDLNYSDDTDCNYRGVNHGSYKRSKTVAYISPEMLRKYKCKYKSPDPRRKPYKSALNKRSYYID